MRWCNGGGEDSEHRFGWVGVPTIQRRAPSGGSTGGEVRGQGGKQLKTGMGIIGRLWTDRGLTSASACGRPPCCASPRRSPRGSRHRGGGRGGRPSPGRKRAVEKKKGKGRKKLRRGRTVIVRAAQGYSGRCFPVSVLPVPPARYSSLSPAPQYTRWKPRWQPRASRRRGSTRASDFCTSRGNPQRHHSRASLL